MRRFNPIRSQARPQNTSTAELTSTDYTVTFDSRDIYITDFIDSQSTLHAIEAINSINKLDDFEFRNYAVINCEYNPPPINIYINSPGGDVMSALSLITTIESSETPIHTHCIGEASSAALVIFSVGHVRHAYKHSIFMYHQISSGTGGTFKDIEDHVKTLKHLQERLENIFALYTKFTKEELEEIRLYKKDYTFYFNEALEKGVADKAILNSIYKDDLEELKDNSKIDILNYKDSSLEEKVKPLSEDDLSEFEDIEVLTLEESQEDSESDNIFKNPDKYSDEELGKLLKEFIQNKENNSKDK